MVEVEDLALVLRPINQTLTNLDSVAPVIVVDTSRAKTADLSLVRVMISLLDHPEVDVEVHQLAHLTIQASPTPIVSSDPVKGFRVHDVCFAYLSPRSPSSFQMMMNQLLPPSMTTSQISTPHPHQLLSQPHRPTLVRCSTSIMLFNISLFLFRPSCLPVPSTPAILMSLSRRSLQRFSSSLRAKLSSSRLC